MVVDKDLEGNFFTDVETDVSDLFTKKGNLGQEIVTDIHNVFAEAGIIAAKAETIAEEILSVGLPIAEEVTKIVYPSADSFIQVISGVLGDLISVASLGQKTATATSAAVTPNADLTKIDFAGLASSWETTIKGIEVDIKNIVDIFKGGVTTKKG